MIRRTLRVVLPAVLVTGLLWWGYGYLFPQSDAALRAQRPAWATCPGNTSAECATIKVPVDHDAPEGETIDLALVKLPAFGLARRAGSVVVNFGGPGISGVDTLLGEPGFFRALRLSYDIVAFDPRGVGKSAPLDCGGRPYRAVDQTPELPKELDALVKARNEYAEACRRAGGALLPHLTTEATARDLDLLRSALREPTLTYFGYSYGGTLGAAYAQLFPGTAGRMVLDSPYRPAGGGPQVVGAANASDEPVEAFTEDCVKRRGCPLGDDPEQAFERLRDLVQNRDGLPQQVSGGRLDDTLAAEGMLELLYSADDWPELRRALAGVAKGDGRALHEAAMRFEEYEGFSRDANTAVGCNDTSTRLRPEAVMEHVVDAREKAPILGPWTSWAGLSCHGWDKVAGDLWRAEPPARLRPIMVVGVTGDPIVPYGEMQQVQMRLPGSVMVSLKGHSHTAYGDGDECVDGAVEAYLLDGVVPAEDVSCPAAETGKP